MGFLQGAASAIPNVLQAVDPDLAHAAPPAFGAGMLPQAGPALEIDVPGAPIDVGNAGLAPIASGAGEVPEHRNFLQRMGFGGKRSVLDIIGGLADVGAKIGQVDPLYQSGLDARHNRERQEVDESWKDKFNTQKLTAGENELDDAQTARLGQASRGLAYAMAHGGPEAALKAWPVIAQQLNISPEKAALFSQQLQADPEGTIASMDATLNAPAATGSLPGSIQEFNLLAKLTPEQIASLPPAAQERLKAMANPNGNKEDVLELRRDMFRSNEEFRAARLRQFERQLDIQQQTADKPAGGKAGGGGGGGGMKMPVAIQTKLLENRDSMRQIENARALLGKNPNSVGAQYAFMPDIISQRTDPAGVAVRAAISDIGSLRIHQRSGATVTVAESPRLRPFIPSASDTPQALTAKLAGLEKALREMNADIEQMYSTGSTAPAPSATPRRTARPGTPAPRNRRAAPAGKPSVSNW